MDNGLCHGEGLPAPMPRPPASEQKRYEQVDNAPCTSAASPPLPPLHTQRGRGNATHNPWADGAPPHHRRPMAAMGASQWGTGASAAAGSSRQAMLSNLQCHAPSTSPAPMPLAPPLTVRCLPAGFFTHKPMTTTGTATAAAAAASPMQPYKGQGKRQEGCSNQAPARVPQAASTHCTCSTVAQHRPSTSHGQHMSPATHPPRPHCSPHPHPHSGPQSSLMPHFPDCMQQPATHLWTGLPAPMHCFSQTGAPQRQRQALCPTPS